MQLRPSMRRAAKMRLALAGASGSGKTYSSLLIAYGMTSDWSRVAVIDSENGSADLYAHLGNYQVLTLPDYSPETYIEAIGICEQAGAEVIVIDSISHCWDYLLDFHANLQGNSFANWAKVTPRQNAFIQRILNSSCHIICTMRSKQDYVLSDKNGKMVPEKVGLKAVQRDNVDYEFTAVLEHCHEPQGHHLQRPNRALYRPSRVHDNSCRGASHPQMVQHDADHAIESFHAKPPQPCFQPFSLNPNLPQG